MLPFCLVSFKILQLSCRSHFVIDGQQFKGTDINRFNSVYTISTQQFIPYILNLPDIDRLRVSNLMSHHRSILHEIQAYVNLSINKLRFNFTSYNSKTLLIYVLIKH